MCRRRCACAHNARYPRRAVAGTRNRMRTWSESVVGEKALADDVLLDLAGALADQQERRVAHQPLDLVFLRIPVSAVNAEALLSDLGTELACQVLRHPGGDVVAFTGVFEPGRVDHHQ